MGSATHVDQGNLHDCTHPGLVTQLIRALRASVLVKKVEIPWIFNDRPLEVT